MSAVRYRNLVYVIRFGSVRPWPFLSKNLFLRVLAYICCTTVYLFYSCTKYIFSHFSRPIKDIELEPKLCNSFPFSTRFGLALARTSLNKLLGHLGEFVVKSCGKETIFFTSFVVRKLCVGTLITQPFSNFRQHVKLCNHVASRISYILAWRSCQLTVSPILSFALFAQIFWYIN